MKEPDHPGSGDLHFGLTFGEEAETGPTERMGGEDPGLQGSPAYSKGFSFGLGCSLTPPLGLGLGLGLGPPHPGAHSPPPRRDRGGGGDIFGSPLVGLMEMGGRRALPCPTIRITSISPGAGEESGPEDEEASGFPGPWAELRGPWRPSRDHLYLPLDPFGHREPSLSPSPGSSPSSRGWASPSSCGSDLEAELSEAAWRASLSSPRSSSSSSSPCPSPGPSLSPRPQASRPSSPGVKRPHAGLESYLAPQASPSLSRRSSPAEDSPSPPSPLPPPQAPAYPSQAAVPRKARRTGQQRAAGFYQPAREQAETRPDDTPVAQQPAALRDGMEYLTVPCPFSWSSKARALGQAPIFPSCSLPPLDWPLPSHCPPLELIVGVQPLPHHRAHYETEGSRGAVKAVGGGHPVVKLQGYAEKPVTLQLFIGTADDRNLRPHTFYQVHRVTGKTVATGSSETLVHGTKVLEVPLLPENNMTTSIDCAGILKLRNSDIELQKGETDIGRKNTRVKMVFRVHVPQSSGKVISLQTSSHPIECSQRSAQELPRVGGSSLAAAPVSGGQRVVISGTNFRPGARVLFMERGADGHNRWEAEAKVDSAETTETRIVAEVPPYPNQTVPTVVPVSFLVCNGRHRRSLVHSFTYLPVSVKEESPRRPELGPISPPLPPPSLPLPPPSLPLPTPEGSLGPPLPLPVAGGGASADTVHSNAPGHPLTPPILLAPANLGRPLTRANPPPSPSDRCQRLTHLNRGNPLAPGHDCQPLTQQHQDHPLAPGHHCRPLTHLDQGNRLAHATLSQPLTRPDRDHPLGLADHCRLLTQHDRGQRLAPVAGSDQSRPVGRWGEQRPLGRTAFYPEAPGRGGPLPSPGGPRTGIGTEHGDNEEDAEGGEIPFNIIPIHGITLDDVNEIIRWDLSEVHECLRMEHP